MRKDFYTCDLCKEEIGEEIKIPHAYIENAFYNISSHGKSVDLCVDCIKEFNEFLMKRLEKMQYGSYTDGQGNKIHFKIKNEVFCDNVGCENKDKENNICNLKNNIKKWGNWNVPDDCKLEETNKHPEFLFKQWEKDGKTLPEHLYSFSKKETSETTCSHIVYCYNNHCVWLNTDNSCEKVDCKNKDKMTKLLEDNENPIDDYEKE